MVVIFPISIRLEQGNYDEVKQFWSEILEEKFESKLGLRTTFLNHSVNKIQFFKAK